MALLELKREEIKNNSEEVEAIILTTVYLRPMEKKDIHSAAVGIVQTIDKYDENVKVFILSEQIDPYNGAFPHTLTARDAYEIGSLLPNLLKRINGIWVIEADSILKVLVKVFGLIYNDIHLIDTREGALKEVKTRMQEPEIVKKHKRKASSIVYY